ncbi:MAG: hypothetical protein PHC96_10265, partial [Firmicutes bacterium]|nr:hypothetical protein [Bacillota bacterium]
DHIFLIKKGEAWSKAVISHGHAQATWKATGGVGTHTIENTAYVFQGFELLDGDTRIDLFASNIASMSVINPDKTTATLIVGDDIDPYLWFNVQKASGDYKYTIVTKTGKVYEATLAWTAPTAATVSFQAPAGANAVFTSAEGGNPAQVDFSKVTADKLLDWTSTKDGYYAIELKIAGVDLSASNVKKAFRVYGDDTAIEPEIKGDLDAQYVTTDWELGTATMYYVLADNSLYKAVINFVNKTPKTE